MKTTEHITKLSMTLDMKRRAKLVYVMSKAIVDIKNCVRQQMQFIR